MAQRVLVAIDDSGPATVAFEYALTRFSDAEIIVLHVIDAVDTTDIHYRVLPEECDQQREKATHTAETVLRTARTAADAAGIELTTATVVGRPARQILAYADENDIDTIVMGTHGRSGLDRLLRGSISDLVRHQSSISVVTVPAPATDSRDPVHNRHAQIQEECKTRSR